MINSKFNLNIENANSVKHMNISLANDIHKSTIIDFLKKYITYMIQTDDNISKEIIKDKVGTICGSLLDRGVMTISNVESLNNYIDRLNTNYNKTNCLHNKYQINSIDEMINNDSIADADPDFKQLKDLKDQIRILESKLQVKYGDNINYAVESFISEFGKNFDSDFLNIIK